MSDTQQTAAGPEIDQGMLLDLVARMGAIMKIMRSAIQCGESWTPQLDAGYESVSESIDKVVHEMKGLQYPEVEEQVQVILKTLMATMFPPGSRLAFVVLSYGRKIEKIAALMEGEKDAIEIRRLAQVLGISERDTVLACNMLASVGVVENMGAADV